MLKPCDQNIAVTLLLVKEMIRLADKGDAEREDTGCGVLYGILRDSAYKIQQLAQEEKRRHQAKGWWPAQCSGPNGFGDGFLNTLFEKSKEEKEDES